MDLKLTLTLTVHADVIHWSHDHSKYSINIDLNLSNTLKSATLMYMTLQFNTMGQHTFKISFCLRSV